ncbi:MAG: hypothetical protein ACK56F_03145, partial [bacterium]
MQNRGVDAVGGEVDGHGRSESDRSVARRERHGPARGRRVSTCAGVSGLPVRRRSGDVRCAASGGAQAVRRDGRRRTLREGQPRGGRRAHIHNPPAGV